MTTQFYVLKRYHDTRRGPNWGFIGAMLFSLAVWAGVIALIVHYVRAA